MYRVIAMSVWCCAFWPHLSAAYQQVIKGGGNLQKLVCVHNHGSQPLPARFVNYNVGVVQTDQQSNSKTLEDIHKAEVSLEAQYGFSSIASITVQASYFQHRQSTTASTMTSSMVSQELALIVPGIGPNQSWCAYRLISQPFQTGISSQMNFLFGDIVVTSGEVDTEGGDLIIDGNKQNWDDPSGYMFSTMKWGAGDGGWYMYMRNDAHGNCVSWQGDPGDQGHLLLQKVDGDNFLLSPKKWPNWYVYMQNNDEGNVRGWRGDPGPQGHWHLKPHPYKQCFLLSTVMWPNRYMYMQDTAEGKVRGWEGDPGDQGCWVIDKAWTRRLQAQDLIV